MIDIDPNSSPADDRQGEAEDLLPSAPNDAVEDATRESSAASHVTDGVTTRAHALTVATLQRHGNRLSGPHSEALRETARLFTSIASGQLRGRFVVDLPTGL